MQSYATHTFLLFELDIGTHEIQLCIGKQHENIVYSYVNRLREITLRILSRFIGELVCSFLSKFTNLWISCYATANFNGSLFILTYGVWYVFYYFTRNGTCSSKIKKIKQFLRTYSHDNKNSEHSIILWLEFCFHKKWHTAFKN